MMEEHVSTNPVDPSTNQVNPNDAARAAILQYFYERNAAASSKFGKNGSAVKISDVKRELKQKLGLDQRQVVANLTYLIDRGWIRTFEIEKTIMVSGGTIPSRVTWYQISAAGIEKIEGGSEFERKERYPGINVTATGHNVITLGDGNVVNATFTSLHRELNTLKDAVTATPRLTDSQKLDIAVDIESIKDQLAKARPDKTMLAHIWSGIEKLVTGAGLVDVIHQVKPLITQLLSRGAA
jgi:hypothetical protein